MLLKGRTQAGENLDRVFNRRLIHINLLEPTQQGAILFEMIAKLLVGRRADAADRAIGKRRLEQVGRIHCPARCRTSTNDGMNFVDEQD